MRMNECLTTPQHEKRHANPDTQTYTHTHTHTHTHIHIHMSVSVCVRTYINNDKTC